MKEPEKEIKNLIHQQMEIIREAKKELRKLRKELEFIQNQRTLNRKRGR